MGKVTLSGILILINLQILFISVIYANPTSLVPIQSMGKIQYPKSQFSMRAAHVAVNCFLPWARNYQPNAWEILQDFNINVISVWGGVEGDIAHFNINKYPDEWAKNLDALLTEADIHGIKVYFHNLGDGFGTLFGIISPGEVGPNLPTPLQQAKQMIDKLAGDNVLGHNFIADPRVIGWRPSNEVDIGVPYILQWNLEICDYIRSKGGKVWLSSPRVNTWDQKGFEYTRPLIENHVDYLEIHHYGISILVKKFDMNFTAFGQWYKKYLKEHMVDARGNWAMDDIILGEFGIWLGDGKIGSTNAVFTEEDRYNYYTTVLETARELGIKNILFHDFFAQVQGPEWSEYLKPNYGIVDVDGSYFQPVTDIIKIYFQ